MKCAADVVNFLNMRFQPTREGGSVSTKRVFWLVSSNDVLRSPLWDCKPIAGSRSFHCVDGYSMHNPCDVRFRTLSCFCDPCVNGQWRRCNNKQHIQEWKYVSIEPLTELVQAGSDEDEDDEENYNDLFSSQMSQDLSMPMYEGDPEVLSKLLSIGDNFAVKAAEENEDFYLLKCTKTMFQAPRVLKDLWHNKIVRGGILVEGLYYALVEGKVDTYTLLEPPVMIYSHLVRAIRFPMEAVPDLHNHFKLSSEIYENIYNSMPYEEGSEQEGSHRVFTPTTILTTGNSCNSLE